MAFVFSACGAESLANIGGKREPSPPTTPVAPTDPLRAAVEIVPDRLYYTALKSIPPRNVMRHNKPLYYFQMDTELLYWNFFLDFGPLNLGQLYRFCTKLNTLLRDKPDHTIVYYSSTAPSKRANAQYLIGAHQILYLNRTPEEALRGFRPDVSSSDSQASSSSSAPPLVSKTITTSPTPPFHDASPCACTYDLTVLDCLRGLAKARMYGFFDFETDFNVEEYEHFEQVENGDLNWIIKDRILAFAGPHYRRNVSPEGHCTLTPADYIPYFNTKNVDLVVRLNKKSYAEEDFRHADIRHVQHYYLDGSCPPLEILDSVIAAFETVPSNKAFAVHCKAGLGRTGTCIGAYLMKHYKFTAAEAIGWMRICRPGMVIGPQQHFLQAIEQRMWQEGDKINAHQNHAATTKGVGSSSLLHITESATTKTTTTSANERSPKSVVVGMPSSMDFMSEHDADAGRKGQADGLLARRNQNKTRR